MFDRHPSKHYYFAAFHFSKLVSKTNLKFKHFNKYTDWLNKSIHFAFQSKQNTANVWVENAVVALVGFEVPEKNLVDYVVVVAMPVVFGAHFEHIIAVAAADVAAKNVDAEIAGAVDSAAVAADAAGTFDGRDGQQQSDAVAFPENVHSSCVSSPPHPLAHVRHHHNRPCR